jgi:hypothetical protein
MTNVLVIGKCNRVRVVSVDNCDQQLGANSFSGRL